MEIIDSRTTVVTTQILEGEQTWENQLRPQSFSEFPGQERLKKQFLVFTKAARARKEPLDHVLLSGPPGLGKTTLARILAVELGVELKITSAPALEKKGDLAALLTSLKPFSVLFIDEIHRLSRTLEEYLYTAMEDYYIDIVTGEGLGARAMKFQLAPFTLVGATTRSGLLNGPFRDRFGIIERLQFYDRTSLEKILVRSAGILGIEAEDRGLSEIAKRARGTPRIANRLLKRVRDYAQVEGNGKVTFEISQYSLNELGVDPLGLDQMDQRILNLLSEKFSGGPAGLDTISAALGENSETIEEVYEPFLIQEGLLMKTSRGRALTDFAREHLTRSSVSQ